MSRSAPGFRPGRGCHTALREITPHWQGVKWYSEGDSTQYFERFEHAVLLSLLSAQLHAKRFLRVIANRLKAG